MADNHRNQGNRYRSSFQDWNNENSGQQGHQGKNWDENDISNMGSQQNRDYGNSSSRYGRHMDEGNNNNRWNQRSNYNQGDHGFGHSDRDYNYGSASNNQDNFGYGGKEYGSSYGGGNYQGNDSYYNSGSSGQSGKPSFGGSRNLYDRDYEGFNRGANSGQSNLGGSNYSGGNEESGRRRQDQGRNYGGYSGSNFGGNFYGGQQRGGQGDSNDRSWWDKTKDEVTSWFGDEDADRRRERERQQNFRGKGPKNYSRSDERIKEDINDRLSDDPWVDASDIDVTVNTGEVTLTGTVNERSEKRRAEDIADAISGVRHVENRLRVGARQESLSSPSGSDTGSRSSIGSTISPGSFGGETAASQTGVTGTTGTGIGSTSEKKR
jgi:osmotically-inducible protein OsmY